MAPCPVCAHGDTSEFFSSRLGWSVRSDWTPVPVNVRLLVCARCRHFFKEPELVRAWNDYENYRVWDNSPGLDKMDFASGLPVTRSAALLAHARKKGVLTGRSSVLDYGCNRGAFLALLGKGAHAGFDVSEQYRSIVEGLGFDYYTPQRPPPAARFDLLMLIHTYEHLEDPTLALQPGLAALKPGGTAFIQVPDPVGQPTDLYVIDHFSHFSPGTLDRSLAKSGLAPIEPTTSILGGEMTGLYRPGTAPGGEVFSEERCAAVRAALTDGEAALLDLKKSGAPCAVFGAGIIGTFVAKVLDGQCRGFVDDNPALHGKTLAGLPVQPLKDVPRELTLVVAMPPSATAAVATKCRAAGYRTIEAYLPAGAAPRSRVA